MTFAGKLASTSFIRLPHPRWLGVANGYFRVRDPMRVRIKQGEEFPSHRD